MKETIKLNVFSNTPAPAIRLSAFTDKNAAAVGGALLAFEQYMLNNRNFELNGEYKREVKPKNKHMQIN